MRRLEGKVAIVTGGATGIGEAICKRFAREGAYVVVNGLAIDPVHDVVNDIIREGGVATAFMADISVEQNAENCVREAIKKYGKLDILVNNAGVFLVMSEIEKYPIDAFDFLVRHNMRTAFMMTRFAIPELQKTKGCVIAAGSEAGKTGIAENAPYGGTKAFLHAFTRGVAVEQAKHGVRANCVCLGAVNTGWLNTETGPLSCKQEKNIVSATPLGRCATPEEAANVYLFLASEESSFMTGALVSVDGGITLSKGAVGEEVGFELTKEPIGDLNLEHTVVHMSDVGK
ncbi:MAG TPA: SDR family oxidoreductase [Cytophagaceae bacterium]|jgi:NAD(P)-dependent dehydrogenase (short-subunit alcohol dehydrogenase family)|nr:SDR family oxidoreductase [Cytophagaceae bacterium]